MTRMRHDLTGCKFDRLTVESYAGKDKTNHSVWKCRCECGSYILVVGYSLIKGSTRSCGCLAHEYSLSGNSRRTHGDHETRLYRIWKNMKTRCNNPNNPSYKNWYGQHGIKVCDEWSKDYLTFKTWSINNGYSENLTLDRINSNEGYCPENCRWVTSFEQANNRSGVEKFEYNGESHTLGEWSKITGIKRSKLYARIKTLGWSIEKALTTNTIKTIGDR